jgi:hypothetical protein
MEDSRRFAPDYYDRRQFDLDCTHWSVRQSFEASHCHCSELYYLVPGPPPPFLTIGAPVGLSNAGIWN